MGIFEAFLHFLKTGEFGDASELTVKQKIWACAKILFNYFVFVVGISLIITVLELSGIKSDTKAFSVLSLPFKPGIAALLASPALVSFAFFLYATRFNATYVKISLSLQFAVLFYRLGAKYFYTLPIIDLDFDWIIWLSLIAIALFGLLTLFINKKTSPRLSDLWNSNFRWVVYSVPIMYALTCYSFMYGVLYNIINIVIYTFFILIFIFIRGSFGFRYAILAYYALSLPILVVYLIYLIYNVSFVY